VIYIKNHSEFGFAVQRDDGAVGWYAADELLWRGYRIDAGSLFKPGDRVRTIPVLEQRDFTPECPRLGNVSGTIVEKHQGHGLCFSVRHDDGVIGCYDPDELTFIL